MFPAFREIFEEVPQDEGAVTSTVITMPGTRSFRNAAGDMRWCARPEPWFYIHVVSTLESPVLIARCDLHG